MEASESPARGRFAIVGGAAALLIVIVAVVALGSGGDDEGPSASAPPECVRAWNSDPAAVSFGRHNYTSHGYTGALVTYLTEEAEQTEAADGLCAVIFPAQALDPEPIAAGEVLRADSWVPLSELRGVELTQVGELQVLAAGSPNASLSDSGKISEL
jgi:hypothetical protein